VQLLVSVRDAEEAGIAVAGGADIVDAKDPAQGALGPVAAPALKAIRAAVPGSLPLSAALGDIATGADVRRALELVTVELAFVKLGFHGVSDPGAVGALLAQAVRGAANLRGRPAVIAVAYADWRKHGSLAPGAFPRLIEAAGAQGLLLDTARKDVALRELVAPDDLRGLGLALARAGLRYALGGSLRPRDLPLAQAAGAGIVGVRGAVCCGGRTGRVELERVWRMREAMREQQWAGGPAG
jgi:uncharacterized protein (UPF0264 family)